MKKLAIIIPARYGSSRFPGKPLMLIAGKSMLQRVYQVAKEATRGLENMEVIIATEDERIRAHADEMGARVVMTPESCKTGSDRALAACEQLDYEPDIVLNIQGDTPLTPQSFVRALAQELIDNDDCDVVTPVFQLNWEELDRLRESKKTRLFSGTTVVIDSNSNALWFSKQIIPAICKEESLRKESEDSPILKHVGLYGYRYAALKRFVSLPEGRYEKLEGLEQLRMVEAGMKIRAVRVDYGNIPQLGVDTPEDAKRAEEIVLEHGL